MITYSDDMNMAYFNGYKFRRDQKTNYFLSSKKINGKRVRLHVYVWECCYGEIAIKAHVHHIDEDKLNNEIENLELRTVKSHLSEHGKENYRKNPNKYIVNLMLNATPRAKEWHRSVKGKEWHKKHYQDTKEKLHQKKVFICINCGKEYRTIDMGHNRFCSNACRSSYRRKSGVDDEKRCCEICGCEFITNRYGKTHTCSKRCSIILHKNTFNKV